MPNPVYSYILHMICNHLSIKLNRSNYCSLSLTIQTNISHLFNHYWKIKQFYFKHFNLVKKVKWILLLLSITNYSIKHQLFNQTVLFQTIQFSISHFFAFSLNAKQFYLTYRRDPLRCYHSGPEWTWGRWQWRRTPHSPKLQHYWSMTIRLFDVIYRTLVTGVLPLCRDTVGVLYSPCRLSWKELEEQTNNNNDISKLYTLRRKRQEGKMLECHG